jgi:hypothetical protein
LISFGVERHSSGIKSSPKNSTSSVVAKYAACPFPTLTIDYIVANARRKEEEEQVENAMLAK